MQPLYPIFLNVEGKPCLVVGGGEVAGRKVALLMDSGALVTVVSPETTIPEIENPIEAIINLFIMGNREDSRVLLSRHLAQQVHDDTRSLRVEGSGRFVGENDPRTIRQRTGYRNTLCLTTGELCRKRVFSVPDFQIFQ